MRLITLDIKYLYVNLPITEVLQATKYWLKKKHQTIRAQTNNPTTKNHYGTKLLPV